MRIHLFSCCLALVLAGCGGGGDAAPDALSSDYQPLTLGDWTMPAGDEGYWCVRATAPADMYISAFRPIAPLGTHHTALALAGDVADDGAYPCSASDAGFKLLFGSGVGTDAFELPEGVAFKLPAGQQVVLNLHLFNTGTAPISGSSGVEVKLIPEAEVVYEAETIYAMDFGLTVPTGTSTYVQSCTMDADVTIFGVFPHMHTLGTRMKATTGDVMLHDQPYSFEEQLNYRLDAPVEVAEGAQVQVECSFDNPGAPVSFGDSTNAEMCVLGLYRYPATGSVSLCLD